MNPVQAAGDKPDLGKGCEEMAMARPFLIVRPLIPSRPMAEMSVQTYLAYRGGKGSLLMECSTS